MSKLQTFSRQGKSRGIEPRSSLKEWHPKGNSLDTLALKGTNGLRTPENGPDDDFETAAVTNITDRQTLLKRARRKYLTTGYVGALVDASGLNDTHLQKSYWNTYHCARTLTLQSDGNITGRYCKNRWCLVCNSIRTALPLSGNPVRVPGG